MNKFDACVFPEALSGCWLWAGAWDNKGYGIFSSQGKSLRAHRVSYEQHKGPIPEGLQIDHLCRVHCCVNPDHLEAVTPKENTLRGFGHTAVNAKKTHCPKGHPYAGENLALYGHARCCKICLHAREKRFRQKRKAAGYVRVRNKKSPA